MHNNICGVLKKTVSVILLVFLLAASCFVLAACGDDTDCVDGQQHYFSNDYGRCMHCHKKYCEAYGQHSYTDGYCEYCGENKSDADKAADGDLPIGIIILLGGILTLVGLVLHRIGISFSSPFFMRAPMVVFLILTLGTFLAYGVLCGIIMTVFLVIYTLGSVSMNRKYLDYDDIF